MAVYDDTIVAGSPSDNDNGNPSIRGSAYIYTRNPLTNDWPDQPVQKLVPTGNEPDGNDKFGWSVAVYGDTIVVGVPGDDGDNSGSAYVYTRDPNTNVWSDEPQKLIPNDSAGGANFGYSVAVYNNTIVVGAYLDNNLAVDSGSAYIYTLNPDTNEWDEGAKLKPNDSAAFRRFGQSVAVYDNIVVVGAPTGSNDNGGSAYIFIQDDLTKDWTQQEPKLIPDDITAPERFGQSVSVYNGAIVVGAPGDDSNTGSAYIYALDSVTNEWPLQKKLAPNNAAIDLRFGWSVSLYDKSVVVGAYRDDISGDNSGSAYIYTLNPVTNEWTQQVPKLVPNDGEARDQFGRSVAVYDNTFVIGAPGDTIDPPDSNENPDKTGKVYIYPQSKRSTEQPTSSPSQTPSKSPTVITTP